MAYGQVNADVIGTSVSGSNLGAGNASIMKNRIINGAMVIDQRNAGAASANTISGYFLDRWIVGQTTTGKLIAQQNAGSVTPPAGFSNYLGVTSQSAYSVGSGDLYYIQQAIEGFNSADLNFGSANAKTVTISFWVRSSLTGTFGGSLYNNAINRLYPFSYTISSANTWEQKSITIAGDTTGTWVGATNGAGMWLLFSLGAGSGMSGTANAWASGSGGSGPYAPTGATSVVSTNGATFYITGVQLEVGSSATGYEYRQYGTELQLCQRYFYKMVGVTYQDMMVGAAADQTTWIRYSMILPTYMRTTPSLVSASASNYINLTGSGGQTGSSIALDNSSATNVTVNLNSSGITAGSAATFRLNTTAANQYLAFSAEL